jgi:hypothetical protein
MLFGHGSRPLLYPLDKFKGHPYPKLEPRDHWLDFVDCILDGKRKPSANFDYAGPLTESVLLGCLASVIPDKELTWDAANLTFPNNPEANALIGRSSYRKGFEIPGLA